MSTVAIAGQTFTFGVGLFQQADTKLLQAAPTIAAGDFQESTNGAAFNNLDNLPTVTPAAGTRVQITLSAAETTAAAAGGEIWVRWIDQAGAEWCDGYAVIKVHAQEIGVLYSTQGAITWDQQKIVADVAGEGALDIENANANGYGMMTDGDLAGMHNFSAQYGTLNTGGTDGMNCTGTANAGIQATGGADGLLVSGTAGYGIYATGNLDGGYFEGTTVNGITVVGATNGLDLTGTTGYGLQADGGTDETDMGLCDVWDCLIAAHLGAGTTGAALNAAGGAGDPWATVLPGAYVAGQAGYVFAQIEDCTCGGGAIEFTYTVTDTSTGLPLEGVEVWISTDAAGANPIWYGTTDAFGVARSAGDTLPMLDAGTYYFWSQKGGYYFPNPDTEIVS